MSNKQTNPEISTMRKKSMEINLREKAKTSEFLCDFRFRNELPDPSAKMKLMHFNRDPDRYCEYTTSLEKKWKPPLHVEPDLATARDLLDLIVLNPPKGKRVPLDPEDEELLRDDPITPIMTEGKKRTCDKGVSWPVKPQHISRLNMESTNQSQTEKQATDLRESYLLESLSNRELQMRMIEASFESVMSPPVHPVNPQLKPLRICPRLPDFDRYDKQFVVANCDTDPIADSEIHGKLYAPERHEREQELLRAREGNSSKEAEHFPQMVAPEGGGTSVGGIAQDIEGGPEYYMSE